MTFHGYCLGCSPIVSRVTPAYNLCLQSVGSSRLDPHGRLLMHWLFELSLISTPVGDFVIDDQ